jgi:hypothetical protein
MDEEGVKYRISLEDMFSGGIHKAHGSARNFEKGIEQITEKLRGVRGMIIEAFAGYELIQFGKDSVKAFEEAERAKSQLDNALKNRDVGFTMHELSAQAEEYAHKWIFSKDQIAKAQVELTKFKNIHGDSFLKTEELAINIASRKGGGIEEWMNTVGRAINDPTHASRLLRPMGIAFTDAQEKMIKQLVNTGNVAKAQDMIFKELNNTFAGSADAAAHTAEGMKAIAGHGWEEFQEKIGGVIDKVEMSLLPMFQEELLPALDKFADWVTDHGDDITHFFEHVWNVAKFFGKTIYDIVDGLNALFDNKHYNVYMDSEGLHWDEKDEKWKKEHGYEAHHPVDQDMIPPTNKGMFDPKLMGIAGDPVKTWGKALVNLGLRKAPTNNDKDTASMDMGSGISEPKASRIQNVTITMQHVMENMQNHFATPGEGASDFKTKLLEALNSVVKDAAIIASE